MSIADSAVPRFVERSTQPYVAYRERVPADSIAKVAHRIPDVLGWLDRRSMAPAGPPFLRYLVVAAPDFLVIEAGFPVDEVQAVDEGDDIVTGLLPAGRYLTVRHHGSPDGLAEATADLMTWAARKNLAFAVTYLDDGEHWVCWLEEYLSAPTDDPELWRTDLTFLLAESPTRPA